MSVNNSNPTVSGWVYDSGTRGTLDIIYGCVVVLIAAVWTVVHLNVPAKGESDGRVVLRRVRWGLVSVFAPDVLTMVAAAQWVTATESLQQMKELSGADDWTLVHAFYALSGGFVLQTPDTETFPINASSLHYLVSRGYIALPSITREEIWDKSKADVFAKGLAILQGGWIIIQAIARTAQGLPLTPLELFTLAFVVSTAMSYFFWWRKPQHVGTPTPIECLVPMSKIWADAGYPEDMPYSSTPIDFVEKASQHWKRRSMFENFDLESGVRRREAKTEKSAKSQSQKSLQSSHSLQSLQSPRLQPFQSPNPSSSIVSQRFCLPEQTELFEEPTEYSPQPIHAGRRDNRDEGIHTSPLSSRASTLVTYTRETLKEKKTMSETITETTEWKVDSNINLARKNGDGLDRENTKVTSISSQHPRQRIADDAIMAARLPTKVVIMLVVPSMLHSGIHLAGWNHVFPTQAEQTLWRVCSVVLIAMSSVGVGLVRVLGQAKYRGRYNLLWVWVNADAEGQQSSSVVWDVILAGTTLFLVLARCFLIVEVCISLRQLPASTFVDVDWTHYIPHI
ncbi:hypothetical protein B0T19DRAFT_275307 [Cercophora scortea]|uniref:Uncharacterized protein n=1 Tax=Cercophora scortea TaxID=314031 RepID=A0AAE0I7Y0_9PEZI|nr:hypothetical protein B0T19DRAFT_275307 [Cercophora scortea]